MFLEIFILEKERIQHIEDRTLLFLLYFYFKVEYNSINKGLL